MVTRVPGHGAPGGQLHAEIREQAALLRAGEAHREQDKITGHCPYRIRYGHERAPGRFHVHQPPPSSCALDTRYSIGYVGQGWPDGRVAGGRGRISSWVTDAAPCRSAVPRQSAPVSPPPMITTCRPAAEIAGGFGPGPVTALATARLACGRYSIAWWMPSRSAPGTGSARGTVQPPARMIAEYSLRSAAALMPSPAVIPQRNSVPSAAIWAS